MFASLNSMFLSPLEGTLQQFNSPCDRGKAVWLANVPAYSLLYMQEWSRWIWDKKKGFGLEAFFHLHSCLCSLDLESKKRLSLIPFKCPHYDGHS